jgi:hypothetical protein
MSNEPSSNITMNRLSIRLALLILLVIVLLVLLVMSCFAPKMKYARKQRKAVEAILSREGHVHYDYEYYDNKYVFDGTLKPEGQKPPGPKWLQNLLGDDFFSNVFSVSLSSDITDREMEIIEGLITLQELSLGYSTLITDDGMKHIRGLTQLKTLSLINAKVTDLGLENLKGLTTLQYLFLAGTKITDAGLEHLKSLSQLKVLGLGNTAITDAGLQNLKGLTQLQELSLFSTKSPIQD